MNEHKEVELTIDIVRGRGSGGRTTKWGVICSQCTGTRPFPRTFDKRKGSNSAAEFALEHWSTHKETTNE